QLAHGGARGLAARHTLLDVVDGALDHHDRVVHHDADRQHDREQGGEIDRESKRRHGGERADDGDRHGRRRDQHRAPVLQEHQDDDEHEDGGLVQRLVHLVDRLLDEFGGVEGDVGDQTLRELALEHGQFVTHFVRHVERVRTWRLVDRQPRRRLAVEGEDLPVGRDPSSTRPTSLSRVISRARPVLTITCANSVGSLSLPVTLSVYWNVWPRGAGGAPICPAVTCVLCCRSASITSCGISPRACILFGSSQTRIEYWPAPNTTTLPTPGNRAISSLSLMVA